MPYRRRYKKRKYKKKQRYKKRYRKKQPKTSKLVLYKPSAMPDTMFVKLKYAEYITMTNVAGQGSYVFAMNGLYDPNITGTGHQPMAYDEWSAFYDQYQVLSSKIYCRILPPDTNTTGVCIYPSRDGTLPNNYADAREQPYSRSKWSQNQSTKQSISNYMSIKKLEGRITSSVNYTATINTNPSAERYWIIFCESPTGTAINDIIFDVQLTYYVKFYGRKSLGQS